VNELTKTDDALKQILDNGWLKNTGRELDVLELGPIDSPHP